MLSCNHVQRTKLASRCDWLTDIISLGLFLLIFYTLYLGAYPLFTPDEGRYSEVAREMITSGDYITPRVNGVIFLDKPILYYWLQATAIHFFGLKEWALRVFPALSGIWGCLITYICGRRLFDRRTGLIAAIILATAPLYFANAHYADLDLEIAVFISSSLLCFITAIQHERLRAYFLYAGYFFAALAFLTKGLIALAFPGAILGCWMLLTDRIKLIKQMHLIRGSLLFLAISLPWYILAQRANPEFLHYFFITQQVTRFLSHANFNNQAPFWFYLPIILIGFFPWTSFLLQALWQACQRIWQAREQAQIELFLLLWIAIILIFFSIPASKIVGYILPLFPALALLTARYLSEAWDFTKPFCLGLFAVFSLIMTVLLLSLPHYQWIAISPHLIPYLYGMSAIFICSTSTVLICHTQISLGKLFFLFTATNLIFLLLLVKSATYLNQASTKPLALALGNIIKPQDEVATYFNYYQDLPLYLERQVTIAADWQAANIATKDNWQRELWYGMTFQKTNDYLIQENEFWRRWSSGKRMFVIVSDKYYKQFTQHASTYYFLMKTGDVNLLSNTKYPPLTGDKSKNRQYH